MLAIPRVSMKTMAVVALAAALICPYTVWAQDVDYSIDVLFDREAEDIDPEDIVLLESLRREPLDINQVQRTELEQLPWISPKLAQAIVAWRNRNGNFGDPGELAQVPGMTNELVSRIKPFIRASKARTIRTRGRWRLAHSRTDRPDAAGNGTLGLQADLEIGRRIKLGGRGERRDRAGEITWRSGYIELGNAGAYPKLILGHAEMDFGQGLVWRSHSIRPSTASLSATVKRRNRGLRPVRTTYASGALRGVALQYHRRGFSVIGILSTLKSGASESGGRLGWTRASGLFGISAVHSGGSVRAGADLDLLMGGTNLFGELSIDGNGIQTVQGGMIWSMERIEGGMVIHRQPDVRIIEKSERSWKSLLLRWKPDRKTTLQLTVEPRLTYRELYSRRALRFRRRMNPGVILSGMWRREVDEQRITGSPLMETWRGQVAWRFPSAVQWRGRYEHRRQSGLMPVHDLRLYMRYRSRERVSLSAQWEYTLAGFTVSEDTGSLFRSNRRARWVILLYGPVGPGISTLVRYTRTRQTRYDQLDVPLVETRWTLQMNVRW